MATSKHNEFTEWELTSEEATSARIFSALNLQYLQNLLADVVKMKLALTLDPNNVSVFIQQEAELQGQIGILKLLIQNSNQGN